MIMYNLTDIIMQLNIFNHGAPLALFHIYLLIIPVKRLNVELSRYQAKYGPLLPSDGPSPALSFGVGDPVPPWLIDSQHLSPLLASYHLIPHSSLHFDEPQV